MSKKMVSALKTKVRKSQYTDLRPTKEALDSGYETYKDLDFNFNSEYEFNHVFIINGKIITNDFIKNLYSKHKSLILKDEKEKGDYHLFLKAVFTEMFVRAGATVPNNSIMEELVTYYNRSGYMEFFSSQNQALHPFELRMYSLKFLIPSYKERIYMSCKDPNCLEFSFNTSEGVYNNGALICDLHNSVEFKLKCKDGNVTYENGKVLLTIPKELKNYKISGKNLFDVIVEYLQKFCEKLGFKFETKVEHSLGEPLTVLNNTNAFHDGINLNSKLSSSG